MGRIIKKHSDVSIILMSVKSDFYVIYFDQVYHKDET